MANDFKKGDKVSWGSSGGGTKGEVVKKVTSNESYEDLDIKASKDEPRYVVKSEKSGKLAAHKPDALKKA